MAFEDAYRVEPGEKVRLADRATDDPAGLSKPEAKEKTDRNLERMDEFQRILYAENKRSILVVFQAMDAGGKDSTTRKVIGPLNPQGCKVTSFKTPSENELAHDFLWRIHRETPARGEIRVFNRSHYEDVLIVRVDGLAPKAVWSKRYDHINHFERLLAESHTTILKFFLHISKDEQLERLNKRLEDPTKFWKAEPVDYEVRQRWDDYMAAYEDVFRKTSTEHAPWYIIPADRKWFRNYAVSQIIADTLAGLDMKYPEPKYDLSDFRRE